MPEILSDPLARSIVWSNVLFSTEDGSNYNRNGLPGIKGCTTALMIPIRDTCFSFSFFLLFFARWDRLVRTLVLDCWFQYHSCYTFIHWVSQMRLWKRHTHLKDQRIPSANSSRFIKPLMQITKVASYPWHDLQSCIIYYKDISNLSLFQIMNWNP